MFAGNKAVYGGNVHDPTIVVGDHREPHHLAAEPEQAGQVGVNDVIPLLIGQCCRVAGTADAACVHQDVYLAEMLDHVLNAGRHRRRVAQVNIVRVHLDSIFIRDLFGVLFELIGPARHYRHVCSGVGHRLCKLQSKSG